MKMVKKILLGLALAGTVLALAGCSGIENDNAKEEGNKWNKTISVDGTELATGSYKRAFVQLGTLEQVQEVTTTLTCKKADGYDNLDIISGFTGGTTDSCSTVSLVIAEQN